MCTKCDQIVERKRGFTKGFYNVSYETCDRPVKWEVQYTAQNGHSLLRKKVCGYHRQYIKKQMTKFNLHYFEIELL